MTVTLEGPYHSIKELADVFGVHYVTMMKLVNRGEVKSIKIGRQYKVPHSEYLRLMAQQQQNPDNAVGP